MTTMMKTEIAARIAAMFSDVEFDRQQMHPYQNEGLQFLKDNPYSALFIDMGLGKTVTAGTLAVDLLDFDEMEEDEQILIIGPLRVATDTWPNEFRKWQHMAAHKVQVVHVDDDDPRINEARKRGYKLGMENASELFTSERQKAATAVATRHAAECRENIRQEYATSKARIHIISRDWVEWLVNFHRAKWPYRTVIIDESSGFKDHNTSRFKALAKCRNSTFANGKPFIRRMHLLTATPAAESYLHLFAQLFLMDGGKRLGKEIRNFQERYFTENKYTRKWKLRPGGEEDILDKIKDICMVMKAKDYLDQEDPIFAVRHVHMTAAEEALYRTMEKDMIVQLSDGSEIEAETAAALSSKLLQMGSGVLYETQLLPGQTEDDDHVKVKKVHQIHDHKIEMLKEIVEAAQGKPILVGYHFKSSLERLKRAFPKAVAMDATGKCIKDWNAGKIPMLLMHPQSGGHGLNLQKGGHNMVFFDIPWSLELYLQFIGRLARQGQKFRVLVQLLVCKGTLDETVVEALNSKGDAQEEMFKILQRMRNKLRKLKGKAPVPELEEI